ncbi:MAG: NUDIX domain-containing protein [Elusimicrobia bacterium]|nr:NUDIX domain-containing protein [Elusimicrobiota bacterium]
MSARVKIAQQKKDNPGIFTTTKSSPVTEWDYKLQYAFLSWINKLFPAARVVGEEDLLNNDFLGTISATNREAVQSRIMTNGDSGSGGYVFIVDPIDGTNAFTSGEGDNFAFTFCVLKDGEPLFAATYLPVSGDLIEADPSTQTVFKNGPIVRPGNVSPADDDTIPFTKVKVQKGLKEGWDWLNLFEGGGIVDNDIPSIAVVAAKMATGEYGGNPALVLNKTISSWDSLPAAIVLSAAGFAVTTHEGKPIFEEFKELIEAGNPPKNFTCSFMAARPAEIAYLKNLNDRALKSMERSPVTGKIDSTLSGDDDTIGNPSGPERKEGSLKTELLSSLPEGVESLSSVRISIRLETEDGEKFLTLRNRKHKDECPGGGVNEGESLLQAVLRELKEELGAEWETIDKKLIRINEKPILYHSITRPDGTVEYRTVYDVDISLNKEQLPRIDPVQVQNESVAFNWVPYKTMMEQYDGFTLASRKVILARVIGREFAKKAIFFRPFPGNPEVDEFPLLMTMDDDSLFLLRELNKGERVSDKVVSLGRKQLILVPYVENKDPGGSEAIAPSSSPSTLSFFWKRMPGFVGPLNALLRQAPWETVALRSLMGLAVFAHFVSGASLVYTLAVPLLAWVLGYSHRFGTYEMMGGKLEESYPSSYDKAMIWMVKTMAFGGLLLLLGDVVPPDSLKWVLEFATGIGAYQGYIAHQRGNREWLVNSLPDLTSAQRVVARDILIALEGKPLRMGVGELQEMVYRMAEKNAASESGFGIDLGDPSTAGEGLRFLWWTR